MTNVDKFSIHGTGTNMSHNVHFIVGFELFRVNEVLNFFILASSGLIFYVSAYLSSQVWRSTAQNTLVLSFARQLLNICKISYFKKTERDRIYLKYTHMSKSRYDYMSIMTDVMFQVLC